MGLQLSQRVQSIKPSPTLVVTAKAAELRAAGRDVIGLAAGEPDFDTPEHIKEAAIQALKDGFTKYTPVPGIPELRQAVVDKFKNDNGLDFEIAQTSVSTGGKQAIYNLLQALIGPGDEVLMPAPYWVSYPDMTLLAEGTPVVVKTKEKYGFKLRPEKLDKAITPQTKLLILNSPSNPTGEAYSVEELEQLGAVLLRHPHVMVMCDDIYEKLVYDGPSYPTLAQAVPALKERCIIINGVSKAYAMTGWRIGYAVGPVPLIKAMNTIQSQVTSGATSIAQKAAVAAMTGPQDVLDPMIKAFRERRDYVVKRVNTIPGMACRKPAGAFYNYINVDKLIGKKDPDGNRIKSSIDLAAFFLSDAEVAVVPGVAFGLDPFFRISFATSMENLEEALNRLERSAIKILD